MANENRRLHKIEAISSGDGKTRYHFYRVGRAFYVEAGMVSEASRRRMERLLGREVTAAGHNDVEVFTFPHGMTIAVWVNQEVSNE